MGKVFSEYLNVFFERSIYFILLYLIKNDPASINEPYVVSFIIKFTIYFNMLFNDSYIIVLLNIS